MKGQDRWNQVCYTGLTLSGHVRLAYLSSANKTKNFRANHVLHLLTALRVTWHPRSVTETKLRGIRQKIERGKHGSFVTIVYREKINLGPVLMS